MLISDIPNFVITLNSKLHTNFKISEPVDLASHLLSNLKNKCFLMYLTTQIITKQRQKIPKADSDSDSLGLCMASLITSLFICFFPGDELNQGL